MAFFAALVGILRRLPDDARALGWREQVPLGCAMGITLGGKGSAMLLAAAGLGSALAVWGFWLQRNPHSRAAVFRRGARSFALAGALGLAIGGYWYARNWARAGSPFFPIGLTVAGRRIFEGLTPDLAMG
jgi:hypothetical protein